MDAWAGTAARVGAIDELFFCNLVDRLVFNLAAELVGLANVFQETSALRERSEATAAFPFVRGKFLWNKLKSVVLKE